MDRNKELNRQVRKPIPIHAYHLPFLNHDLFSAIRTIFLASRFCLPGIAPKMCEEIGDRSNHQLLVLGIKVSQPGNRINLLHKKGIQQEHSLH